MSSANQDGDEHRINLKVLKKVDPYIKSIEAHSNHVALYRFQPNGEWEKTGIEGTMFVYQREAEPTYGWTIVNRLSQENKVEPVTKQMDFQLKSPFLLYKNQKRQIFGVWFFEKKDCERVANKVISLVKLVEEQAKERRNNNQAAASGGLKLGSGADDLTQLLQKAKKKNDEEKQAEEQDETSQSENRGRDLLRLISQADVERCASKSSEVENLPEETTASVKDFFALATSSSNNNVIFKPDMVASIPMSDPLAALTGKAANGNALPVAQTSAFDAIPMSMPEPMPAPIACSLPGLPAGFATIQALPISQGLAMGKVPVGGLAPYLMSAGGGNPSAVVTTVSAGGSANPLETLLKGPTPIPGVLTVDQLEQEQILTSTNSPQPGVVHSGHGPRVSTQTASPMKQPGPPSGNTLTDLASQLKQQLHIGSHQDAEDLKDCPHHGPPFQAQISNGNRIQQPNHRSLISPMSFSDARKRSSRPAFRQQSEERRGRNDGRRSRHRRGQPRRKAESHRSNKGPAN